MSAKQSPRFQLSYWPLPFRGCFVSYMFAYRNEPLTEVAGFEEIGALLRQPVQDQDVPFMGPPVLHDREAGVTLSQMPAIVLYVARPLSLLPADEVGQARCMKILMDCNDVLMEICRYNGSSMWTRDEWLAFRNQRLPKWLTIFEACLNRGFIGTDEVSFADIGVFALFGNMMRCLPELEPDVQTHAPGIHALCARIGSEPSLAAYVAADDERYGKLYCGGQIEASIREMLELDAA